MTDRRWIGVQIVAVTVMVAILCNTAADISYTRGYQAGVRAGRTEADHRVHVARAECRGLLENQRVWYEGLHDRASVVWKENTAALLRDLTAYERDLEGCLGRRRR